ncbi:hypothetical protein FA13DRAFT_1720195 [Coprinellus micaceus]|uniref:Uncharacterized protein n=1 Tax=Coprinellus micaceus TaxID=71717 RepID=A0A4Y7SA82_COPMI|nr:hypothetical protein FA13DRAFT_1720195 [Coprinellus micaceus]
MTRNASRMSRRRAQGMVAHRTWIEIRHVSETQDLAKGWLLILSLGIAHLSVMGNWDGSALVARFRQDEVSKTPVTATIQLESSESSESQVWSKDTAIVPASKLTASAVNSIGYARSLDTDPQEASKYPNVAVRYPAAIRSSARTTAPVIFIDRTSKLPVEGVVSLEDGRRIGGA